MAKQTEAWTLFMQDLSEETQAALARQSSDPLVASEHVSTDSDAEIDDYEAREGYKNFLANLSEATATMLRAQAEEPQTPRVKVLDTESARWHVVETKDGEWPRLRMFRKPADLAAHLQRLEGQDVTVWCFYGLALQITKGPQRYLRLPDGKFLQIPLYENGPCETVTEESLQSVEFEEAGYIGPPELAETSRAEETVDVDDEG